MSQERVLMFRVVMLMFSNLTDVFVGKRWSEDVVSGNKMELEDKDELSQPVTYFPTSAWRLTEGTRSLLTRATIDAV